MSVKETVQAAKNAKEQNNLPDGQSFGSAIDMGDMTEQGIKAADNLCASFYRAFNDRMDTNLKAMRSHLSKKTILIPAEQKSLPPSEGSFMDAFYEVAENE